MRNLELSPMAAELAPQLEGWTFPAYRHLLAGVPDRRHSQSRDPRRILPIGCVAWHQGEPIGLALGGLPLDERPDNFPELLSLFVHPEHRGRGVAGSMVEELEDQISETGFSIVTATYTTHATGTHEPLERLFAQRGWGGPQVRLRMFRYSIAEIPKFRWWGRYRFLPGLDAIPWTEVSSDEIERLIDANTETPWIDDDLLPWNGVDPRLEKRCSLAVRENGQVVGWILCHRHDDLTLRYTNSFVRDDLARCGQLIPAWCESLERAAEAGYEQLMFTVDHKREPMTRFVERHCQPALSAEESRWVWKRFPGGQRHVAHLLELEVIREILPNGSAEVRRPSPECPKNRGPEGPQLGETS